MPSLTITLAGTPYVIQELTIGQLEDIHAEMTEVTAGPKPMWRFYRRVICIALSVDHPEVTDEILGKMRLGTLQIVKTACDSIVEFGGFSKRAETASGEAPARAA